ncbi:MAG: imidazole glycerol phosphate synthase cyclase subunit [Candidatus Omnitrophica bacterium]|nr:imidazole glycerol phosphate synthase cyclase subunit [Candidatus Omnitrophota bacterium]MDD5352072.1 imidazole glycerol phosphate synthase cyclase subunit [Candidatus Omnitrophota bacterium]MDD5549670.1 imidazole glycerol phosphate synthase cyclase subunit [Candidatus Omnitrophota bacterium]
MTSLRIIPFFLLKGKRLVKGTQFKDFKDVGDPLSQAMIYDAQGADEIIIVDIEASRGNKIIDTNIINRMISKCRLPIGAGGGIKTVQDADECFRAGADKIIVNTHAILRPPLVKELVKEFGSQSVVVSLDVRKNKGSGYDVYVFSGEKKVDNDFNTLIKKLIDCGAGEFIITSIDKEGTLSGFDYDLYAVVRNLIPVPLIASGGCGCYEDIVKLHQQTDCDACAIGKLLFLRDYDIVRIKSYIKGKKVLTREA